MLSLEKWKFTLIFFPYTVVQNEYFHFKTEQEENKKKWHTVSLNTKENTKSFSSKSSIILRRRHSCSNSFGYAHPSRSAFCGVCNFSRLPTLSSCLQVFLMDIPNPGISNVLELPLQLGLHLHGLTWDYQGLITGNLSHCLSSAAF